MKRDTAPCPFPMFYLNVGGGRCHLSGFPCGEVARHAMPPMPCLAGPAESISAASIGESEGGGASALHGAAATNLEPSFGAQKHHKALAG